MKITAKFPGTCSTCGGKFAAGEQINWTKGGPTSHAECPTAASATPAGNAPKFAPTPEQANALALFATGKSLAIEAGAGTGKTSTLMLLAQSTERRGQYVAFNKSIVTDSKGKFPATVKCNTAHSLAHSAIVKGTGFGKRVENRKRLKSTELASILRADALDIPRIDGEGHKTLTRSFIASLAIKTVRKFCQTADLEITERHVPRVDGIDHDGEYQNQNIVARHVAPIARRAWEDLSREDGILPFGHDHYLKLWHLSGPTIKADYILFDEAQDANPVMQAVVAAQTHAQLVWVGDSQQQIYSFTGAINALATVGAEQTAFLTQSFRFGPAIAEQANAVLADLPSAQLRLTGTDSIASRVEALTDPDAILCRTNAAALMAIFTSLAEGKRPALVGGTTEITWFARAARDLQQTGSCDHPELGCFDSWDEVRRYVAEDSMGEDLALMVKIIDEFGVEEILTALDRLADERDADVIVSTAHKAKGREWERVRLAGDFPGRDKAGEEERRLLYVAITRARLVLDIEAVSYFTIPAGDVPAGGPASAAPATPEPIEAPTPAPIAEAPTVALVDDGRPF